MFECKVCVAASGTFRSLAAKEQDAMHGSASGLLGRLMLLVWSTAYEAGHSEHGAEMKESHRVPRVALLQG